MNTLGRLSYFVGGSALIFAGTWLILHDNYWGLLVAFLGSLVSTQPLSMSGAKLEKTGEPSGMPSYAFGVIVACILMTSALAYYGWGVF